MQARVKRFFRQSGHYLLAVLFAAVILLSALWTRTTPVPEASPAQLDQSQRLSQVTPSPAPLGLLSPVSGEITLSFSRMPVHFPEYHVTRFHPATHFAAEKGQAVRAAFAGTLRREGSALFLEGDGFTLRYKGVEDVQAADGALVKQGAVLGKAAGHVPWEGDGFLCLTLYKDEEAIDIAPYLQ